MSSLGLVVLVSAVVVIVVGLAVLADVILDATVLGSYLLVRRALQRTGKRWYALVVAVTVLLAIAATALGILANLGR